MKPSLVKKRSITIGGHQTSVSLEDQFWNYLKDCARAEHLSLTQFIAAHIDTPERTSSNLSSAIRLYVLNYVKGKTGC